MHAYLPTYVHTYVHTFLRAYASTIQSNVDFQRGVAGIGGQHCAERLSLGSRPAEMCVLRLTAN